MERRKFQESMQMHCYEKGTGPELEKALRSYGSELEARMVYRHSSKTRVQSTCKTGTLIQGSSYASNGRSKKTNKI